jgi:nucleoside-diphosphate-sugar epimerase
MQSLLCLLSFLAIISCSVNSVTIISKVAPKSVLLIGGTRFSGLYLWKELQSRGHHVTLFNRGKTTLKPLPNESQAAFDERVKATTFIKGNRQVKEDLDKLSSHKFDVIYDLNGRDVTDTAPLADMFKGKVDQFVYMSSAGVYKKSVVMPHFEVCVICIIYIASTYLLFKY